MTPFRPASIVSIFRLPSLRALRRAGAGAAGVLLAGLAAAQTAPAPQLSDYIVAVVGRELVTNAEIQRRVVALEREAQRAGQALPPAAELRSQVLEQMIQERAQLAHARESGVRVSDEELDRALANIAASNRLSPQQLRERLQQEGTDPLRFRSQLRDQMLVERVREREVQGRIRVSDAEIDRYLEQRQAESVPEYHIAQILVPVPEGASESEIAQRRAVAERALARAKAGEPFATLVDEYSGGSKANGGSLGGLRTADRLPDLFVEAVKPLRSGALVPAVLRSGAGFHVLKLVERSEGGLSVQQSHARHILLRTSPQLGRDKAVARLRELRGQIESGRLPFAQAAREVSEDSSAPQGGDLGWASPGQFVPEFEQVMDRLPIGAVSDPVVSRFGVHLIEVVERRRVPVDRRQLREAARNAAREQKYEPAYEEWARDIRARAYVEMREPPR